MICLPSEGIARHLSYDPVDSSACHRAPASCRRPYSIGASFVTFGAAAGLRGRSASGDICLISPFVCIYCSAQEVTIIAYRTAPDCTGLHRTAPGCTGVHRGALIGTLGVPRRHRGAARLCTGLHPAQCTGDRAPAVPRLTRSLTSGAMLLMAFMSPRRPIYLLMDLVQRATHCGGLDPW